MNNFLTFLTDRKCVLRKASRRQIAQSEIGVGRNDGRLWFERLHQHVDQRGIVITPLLVEGRLQIAEAAQEDLAGGGDRLNQHRDMLIGHVIAGHDLMDAVNLSMVKAIDQKWLSTVVDAAEEMAGVIDALDLEPEALRHEDKDQREPDGIGRAIFNAPSQVGVPRIVVGRLIALKSTAFKQKKSQAIDTRHLGCGAGFVGKHVQLIRQRWSNGYAVVKKIGNLPQAAFEMLPVVVHYPPSTLRHFPIEQQIFPSCGLE